MANPESEAFIDYNEEMEDEYSHNEETVEDKFFFFGMPLAYKNSNKVLVRKGRTEGFKKKREEENNSLVLDLQEIDPNNRLKFLSQNQTRIYGAVIPCN